MAVGYLYAKGHFAFMTPSTTTIQNMEQNGIFSSLSRLIFCGEELHDGMGVLMWTIIS